MRANANGTADRFALIDLQRVFRPRWRRRRWVVKDLAALDYSTPADRVDRWERLRFLSRYVRHHRSLGSARRLARSIGRRRSRLARRSTATGAATTEAQERAASGSRPRTMQSS